MDHDSLIEALQAPGERNGETGTLLLRGAALEFVLDHRLSFQTVLEPKSFASAVSLTRNLFRPTTSYSRWTTSS